MSLSRGFGFLLGAFVLGQATFACGEALNYHGRISVDGVPFSGAGHFAFIIQDANGAILWTSGDIPFEGRTNLPPGTVNLPVKDGGYSIRLGDPAAAMPALDAASLLRASGPKLQVWFNEGRRGWQLAGDAALAPALDAARNAPPDPNDAVLREVRELRGVVERLQASLRPAPSQPAPPTTATVAIGDSPALGSPNAPLVMVEFTDYQCPFCKRFQDQTFSQLLTNYVDTGKLRIVSRNLPLSFHANADPAAQAALCADQQHQFWSMREKLFADAEKLTVTNFVKAAGELNLDVAAFQGCLTAQTFAERVKKDGQDAGAVGITGTPSFVLGRAKDGKVTGPLLIGALPYATFDSELQKLLTTK